MSFFLLMEKTATSFHQSIPLCTKQIMAGKPLSAVVCCFQVWFMIKWEKTCQMDWWQLYSQLFVRKIILKSAANNSSCLWLQRRFCGSHFSPSWKETASLFHSSTLHVFVFVIRECFCATYQGVFFRRLLVSSTPYINQKATVYTDMETHHITPWTWCLQKL